MVNQVAGTNPSQIQCSESNVIQPSFTEGRKEEPTNAKVEQVAQNSLAEKGEGRSQIASVHLPSPAIHEIAKYLTLEEQTNVGKAACSRQDQEVDIMTGLCNAQKEMLWNFCKHKRLRDAWKAFFGRALPTCDDIAKMPPEQVRRALNTCIKYIDKVLENVEKLKKTCDFTIDQKIEPEIYFHPMFGHRSSEILGAPQVFEQLPYFVNKETWLSTPERMAILLEGARLYNLINMVKKPCYYSREGDVFDKLPLDDDETVSVLKTVSSLECYDLWVMPPEICMAQSLETLNIERSPLIFLLDEIENLQQLRSLTLYRCPNLESLPKSIGKLSKLERLVLVDTPIRSLPLSMAGLSLKKLSLPNSMRVHDLPSSFSQEPLTETEQVLKALREKGCVIGYR